MIVGVRINLRAPRLISRGPEVYNRALTLVVLRRFELVTTEKQIQSLTTKLPFKVNIFFNIFLIYLNSFRVSPIYF